MKLLIDFLPIVIFFLVYKFAPESIEAISPLLNADQIKQLNDMPAIILATVVIVPASILQILYTKISTGRVETLHSLAVASWVKNDLATHNGVKFNASYPSMAQSKLCLGRIFYV
jgi:intracellular septation protein A